MLADYFGNDSFADFVYGLNNTYRCISRYTTLHYNVR
jgi:hypothetical protein